MKHSKQFNSVRWQRRYNNIQYVVFVVMHQKILFPQLCFLPGSVINHKAIKRCGAVILKATPLRERFCELRTSLRAFHSTSENTTSQNPALHYHRKCITWRHFCGVLYPSGTHPLCNPAMMCCLQHKPVAGASQIDSVNLQENGFHPRILRI